MRRKKRQIYYLKDFSKKAKTFKYKKYLLLVQALQRHNYLYYVQNSPEISDGEYTDMMKLLIEVEKENLEWRVHDSPSLKIGGEVSEEFLKTEHEPPMMSLDNASNWQEFLAFDARLKKQLQTQEEQIYHAELKFDGLGIELIYKEGLLTIGSTRGDGSTGENITHNIRTVRNIPLRLMLSHPPQYLSVRGECILPISEFEKINREMKANNQKIYANPRNVASGTLRQKNPAIVAKRGIQFFPYSIGKISESKKSLSFNKCPTSQKEIYSNYLSQLGFCTSKLTRDGQMNTILKFYEELQKKRSELEFDIDGIVVKLDDSSTWERLGTTSKAPRYAIALKFPSRKAITKIINVSFQVGRTGTITPVAHLNPINIGGVIVQKASLHNEDEINKLNIQINDLVEVERAGDVIPKVIKKEAEASDQKKILFPKKCPSCQNNIIKEKVHYKCRSFSCDEKILANLKYSVSKDCLDIEGLGYEWISKLYKKKIINDIADIYSLKISDIDVLEGMGDTLAKKIISAINIKRKIKYSIFIRSLGIPNIGSHTAEVITKEFYPIEKLMTISKEEMTNIHEIGEITTESIFIFFADKKNKDMLKRLFTSGFEIDYAKKNQHNTIHKFFYNKSFIFTGSLKQMTRSQAQEIVLKVGGKIVSSISKQTDYLISGEKSGSKQKKAISMGISILSEKEFLIELEKVR